MRRGRRLQRRLALALSWIASSASLFASAAPGVCAASSLPDDIVVLDTLFTMDEAAWLEDAAAGRSYRWGETDFARAPPAGTVHELDVGVADGGAHSGHDPLLGHLVSRVWPNLEEMLRNGTLRLDGAAAAPDRRVAPPDVPPLQLYRAYVNLFRRGDSPRAHRDAPLGANHVTCLVYANREWARDWGGETVFYDETHEIRRAVRPRPGRAVCFTGGLMHAARPPLPEVNTPRYTIALKWEAEDNRPPTAPHHRHDTTNREGENERRTRP